MRCSLMRHVHVWLALHLLRGTACRIADQSRIVRISSLSQGGKP